MKLMSVLAVADRMDVSPETVRRLVRNGDIQHSRVGIQIRISEQQLQAYLHREPAQPETKGKRGLQTVYTAPAAEPNWAAFNTKHRRKAAI